MGESLFQNFLLQVRGGLISQSEVLGVCLDDTGQSQAPLLISIIQFTLRAARA